MKDKYRVKIRSNKICAKEKLKKETDRDLQENNSYGKNRSSRDKDKGYL